MCFSSPGHKVLMVSIVIFGYLLSTFYLVNTTEVTFFKSDLVSIWPQDLDQHQ